VHRRRRGVTRTLSGLVQRPVVDRTGLTGEFDIVLVFARDPGFGPTPPPGITLPPPPENAPSLFTALQEQLGLKLEPTRAPLEYHASTGSRRHPPTEAQPGPLDSARTPRPIA
jgi:uncharacterized protein (TIGR03435 family)